MKVYVISRTQGKRASVVGVCADIEAGRVLAETQKGLIDATHTEPGEWTANSSGVLAVNQWGESIVYQDWEVQGVRPEPEQRDPTPGDVGEPAAPSMPTMP